MKKALPDRERARFDRERLPVSFPANYVLALSKISSVRATSLCTKGRHAGKVYKTNLGIRCLATAIITAATAEISLIKAADGTVTDGVTDATGHRVFFERGVWSAK